MAETPLITYLRIQQATDRKVLAAVRRAAVSVDSELRRLQGRSRAGDVMRREQLLQSQAAINRRLETLFSEVGDVTQAGRAAAAAAGAESILRESQSLLETMMSPEDYRYMAQSVRASAQQSIEVMMQRVNGTSYVPLAQSVWGNQARANATVGKLVEDALARGASAAELAKQVRQYVNPNTPGGTRYASLRLARTELNNAFHAAQVKQAQDEPWTLAVRWNLSGSHPKPDECNDYADSQHYKGGEPGRFLPDEVPSKPHPNCLCYTTPETPDPDEFISSYLDGRYDPYLEDLDMPEETLSGNVNPPAARGRATPSPKGSAPQGPGDTSRYAATSKQIEEAVMAVNPKARLRPTGEVFHTTLGSSVNCQKTAYASELRLRGRKVVAEDTMGGKRDIGSIKSMWKPRDGEKPSRGFSGSTAADLTRGVAKDPVGSRYILVSTWKNGGAHVYNAVKQADGSLRFFDGQKKVIDATQKYLQDSRKVQGFRVDNMEPAAKHKGMIIEEQS